MDTESTPASADEVSAVSSTTDELYYIFLVVVAAVILCVVTIWLLYCSRKRRSNQVHVHLTGNNALTRSMLAKK